MERDLHDGAQQHLALLNLQLSVLERSTHEHPALAANVGEMRSTLAAALVEMRNLAHGIYPAALENDGLTAALAEAAARASLPTKLEVGDLARASRDVETAVYFCCLEALQNASKHAGDGASATITLAQQNGILRFTVADDGAGFDQATDGHGLHNMRDRIGALGGEVSIDSTPGRGVTVSGSVPVARARVLG
ncbi:MAG: sensor histidine kinase [Aeromicrobium sp.]